MVIQKVWNYISNERPYIPLADFYNLYLPQNSYYVQLKKRTIEEEINEFRHNFAFPFVDLIDGNVSFSDFSQYHTILSCSIEDDLLFAKQTVCNSFFIHIIHLCFILYHETVNNN